MGLVVSLVRLIIGRQRDADGQQHGKFAIRDGITLYDNERSPCARRVRMTLLEKNVQFRKVEVDLLKNEQSYPEFKKISPNRKVPALAIHNVPGLADCTLFESNVITEYLDTVLPGPNTYPSDPWRRAQAKMWQNWELSMADTFWPLIYVNILGFIKRMVHSRDSYIIAQSTNSNFQRERNIRTFEGTLRSREEFEADALACYKAVCFLEQALEGKTFLVGDTFTTADLSVVPRLLMFESAGIPISEPVFPNTYHYLKRMAKRRCFVESEPLSVRIPTAVLSRLFPLVVAIGNWRQGKKLRPYDGSALAVRAKAESANIQTIGRPLPGVTAGTVVLFDYPTAAECWQVKLMLRLKGIGYDTVPCDVMELVGRSSGAGNVFRIQHGDRLVTGCRALLDFLDSTFPTQRLIPEDPLLKAEFQCWQAWENYMASSDLDKTVDLILVSKLMHSRFEENLDELLGLRSNPQYTETFAHIMTAFLSRVERGGKLWGELAPDYGHLVENLDLAQRADNCCLFIHGRLAYLEGKLKDKAFLVGGDLTMADICVFCRLLYLPSLGIKISEQKYPNVCRWFSDLKSREHFTAISDEVDELFGH